MSPEKFRDVRKTGPWSCLVVANQRRLNLRDDHDWSAPKNATGNDFALSRTGRAMNRNYGIVGHDIVPNKPNFSVLATRIQKLAAKLAIKTTPHTLPLMMHRAIKKSLQAGKLEETTRFEVKSSRNYSRHLGCSETSWYIMD